MCGSSSTTRMCNGFASPRGAGAGSVRTAGTPTGSSTANVAPLPGRVSRVMRPPCSFRMPWQIDSPNPVPWPSGLVVKNGSNTRRATSSGIPGPESVTLTAMTSCARLAVIQIRPEGASLAIAWQALLIRFTNTCLIWLAFTSTSGRPGSTSRVASTLRSEEHTSELQSQSNLVCRLLLEKKKKKQKRHTCGPWTITSDQDTRHLEPESASDYTHRSTLVDIGPALTHNAHAISLATDCGRC